MHNTIDDPTCELVAAFDNYLSKINESVVQNMKIRDEILAIRNVSSPKETAKKRLGKGMKTAPKSLYDPILTSLLEHGGSMEKAKMIDDLENRLRNILKIADTQKTKLGTVERWKLTVDQARLPLAKKGLIEGKSKKGIWKITPAGRDYLFRRSLRHVA